MRRKLIETLKILVLTAIVILNIQALGAQEYINGALQGKIRIKIKPEVAKSMSIKKSLFNNVISTGIKGIDQMNSNYAVSEMKRVFPYSPRYEERHKLHGLDLWYEISIGAKASSTVVVEEYKKLQEIDKAEQLYETKLIDGSGAPVYLSPEIINRTSSLPFNDPYLPKQWQYNNTGQTGGTPGADINLFNAWKINVGNPKVIVSIHDMGVQVNHDDLKNMMWVNLAELNGVEGVDDDGNGYIDDINGFNFTNNSGTIETGYHATHVAGTVAAENNNGIGVSGVAGGSGKGDGVRIMSCQILGGTHEADVADSYVYAADNGAVISQNSWGYVDPLVFEQATLDAIDYFISEAGNFVGSPMKGGVVIFAAGNSSTEELSYPGAYPSCIAVSALDALSTVTNYSNYGTWVDISAPGGDSEDDITIGAGQDYSNSILSTLDHNSYGYLDGTSMACPHVSGVAALIVSKYGSSSFTNNELKTHLLTGVRDIYNLNDNLAFSGKLGSGALDAVLGLANDNKKPPVKISNLSLTGIAQDFATINWSVPSDPDDGSPVSFEILVSRENILPATISNAKSIVLDNISEAGQAMTYEIKDLQSLTNYYFAIRSRDRWGNYSDLSNILNRSTNSGPIAVLDSLKTFLSINLNVNTSSLGMDSILLSNKGEGVLRWDALTRQVSAIPLSVRPALHYPLLQDGSQYPMGIMSNKLRPMSLVPFSNIQKDTLAEKGYMDMESPLMVYGETNLKLTNSSATRFYVSEESGFNITNVDAFLSHDEATGPVIMEIYKGPEITSAQLLLAQEIATTSSTSFTYIQLDEQIYLEQGSYFWLVFHVPAGNKFPLGGGVEMNKEDSKNCYMSLNGGKTWRLFEELYKDNQIVWAVYAISNQLNLNQYVKLTPDTGVINPNASKRIIATVDAKNLVNGQYKSKLVINTNETGKSMLRIPVVVNIQGHKPEILQIKRVDFGNIFLGNSKELSIEVKNIGLGKFVFQSPNLIVSNPQFELKYAQGGSIESGAEQSMIFSFKPTSIGNILATVKLLDVNGNNYSFELFGVGIEPPVARINPQKITVSGLAIGDTIKGQFYLSNQGKYSLDYYLPSFADGSNMLYIPDNIHKFGYSTQVDSIGGSYVWNDISATGTDITAGFKGNDMTNIYQKIPLNFLFPFFGKNENFVFISKFGVLSFTDNGAIWSMTPVSFKSTVNPDRYISAAGYPMLFQEAGFGKVLYKRESDKFIVQYDDVPEWSGIGYSDDYTSTYKASQTFQIVLYDNGNISMYFKECSMGLRDRQYSLIAIEDRTKKDGLLVSGANYGGSWNIKYGFTFKPGSAVHFTNPGLGLFSDINHPSGSVLPNDSLLISYKVRTDSLSLLQYTENMVIVTNDPVNNPAIHRLDFNITSGGTSILSADSLSYDFETVYKGAVFQKTLLVSNKGKATDNIISAAFDNGYFTLTGPIPELLKPERTTSYSISIKTNTVGPVQDTLRITSQNGKVLKIALRGNVVLGPMINVLNSTDSPLSSITKINVQAGTSGSPVLLKIKNTGSATLNITPLNTEWTLIDEKVRSAAFKNSYNWKSSKEAGGPRYDWIDITESGIKIKEDLSPLDGREWTSGIKMPFSFSYYGINYDTLYIGYSGLVTFTKNQNDAGYFWGGSDIPSTDQPNNYIAPLYLFGGPDMISMYPLTGQYYKLENDRVIVEFRDYNTNFSMGPPVSFELILSRSGGIKFQYKMPEDGNNTVTNQGTIGIENTDGTEGIMISEYQTVVNSDMAIGIYPMKQYLVSPGDVKEFNVTLSALDLVAGSYSDSLLIINNDPLSLLKKIPLKLVVKGNPVVDIPDSIDFGDIIIDSTKSSIVQEFYLKNSGTANYSVTSTSQKFPDDFKLEAYLRMNNTWSWMPIMGISNAFPRTIEAYGSLHMRVTVSPVSPALQLDTFKLSTDAGNYSIPLRAAFYYSPVAAFEDADMNKIDTLFVYAANDDYNGSKTINLRNLNDNRPGGYKLNYKLGIVYQRDTIIETSTKVLSNIPIDSSSSRIYSRKLEPSSFTAKPLQISASGIIPMSSFNRILANDTASKSETSLGYGGGMAFYTATAFDAPDDGFNLTHVQTWYIPGEWLNSKIQVKIYGGSDDINNATLLHSQTFSYSSPSTDKTGKMLTFELSKSLAFFPNERFFIVFGYDVGATNPQGSVLVQNIRDNRYLFGPGDSWYDITSQGTLGVYGWMVRACEEHVKATAWVTLDSPTRGEISTGSTVQLKLSFASSPAAQGDNFAMLVLYSNELNKPIKNLVLHLRKNKGPEYDASSLRYSVSENDTLRFAVIAHDFDGDNFSLELDSNYSFLNSMISDSLSAEVTKGIIPVNHTLELIYTPDYNSQGTHIFYVRGKDSNGNVTRGKIVIEVLNVNRPPVPLSRDTIVLKGNLNYFMVKPEYLFADPDVSDVLVMDALVDNPGVVAMYASGNSFILAPLANGTSSISFNVSDPFGESASNVLNVRVENVETGIDADPVDRIKIYPNPTSGLVFIKIPENMNGQLELTLSNSMGEILLMKRQFIVSSTLVSMDLSNLPTGLYFTKISCGGKVSVQKISKK